MKQLFLLLCSLVALLALNDHALSQELILLPQPQSIKISSGFYDLDALDEITISYPSLTDEKTNARTQLTELFADRSLKWKSGDKADIAFELVDTSNTDAPDHMEGYLLQIENGGIHISARSESGLFYAIQTLKQVFDEGINEVVPHCTILDYPTLDVRGLMDDISRGPLPNMRFAKEQIRRLSELKYNLFTFYIEHVVKTVKHGSFAPKEAWTIKDIEELSAYAALHNMQLVGSFQSLGHFDKILEFPQYRHLGSTSRMLKPGDSVAIRFVQEVVQELAPAFNGSVFNLNGDEAWDLERAANDHPEGLTSGELYLRHMKPLLDGLIKSGVRPLICGDMLMQYPEIIAQLPAETIVLTWDYSDRMSFAKWIDPFQNSKLDYWVCPGVLNTDRFYPDFTEAFNNILGFLEEGLEKETSGMLLTVWDDGGRHFFSRDWPGVAFGAEQSWHYARDLESSYMDRFGRVFYGDSQGVLADFLEIMQSLKSSPVMLSMNNGAFTADIFPSRDQQLSFSSDNWAKVLQTTSEARAVLDQLSSLSGNAYGDLVFWKFTLDQLELLANSRIKMIELSDAYRKASFIQLTHPDSAKHKIEAMGVDLEDLRVKWEQLFNEFERLWLVENRTYWLEEANEPFEKHLKALGGLQARLEEISVDFYPVDQIYLPAPAKAGFTVADITSSYFNDWLVAGPFKIDDYENDTRIDFLEKMGGEPLARPNPGTLFQDPNGDQKMWDRIASTYSDRLVFAELFQENTKAVAYAYCQIDAQEAMEVTAAFGSNDGAVLYLNGEEVFREHTKRNMIKGENTVALSLAEGTNHVLFKIDQWKGRWELSFNLEGVEWTSNQHQYTISR